jgi:hypothetical protein
MSFESLLRSLLSFLFFSVRLRELAPSHRDVAFDIGKKNDESLSFLSFVYLSVCFIFPLIFGISTSAPQLLICVATKE